MTLTKASFRAGALLLAGSLVIICMLLLWHTLARTPAGSQPLLVGQSLRSDWLELPEGRFRVVAELTARTHSFAPEMHPGGAGSFQPLFRFPVDYRVVDDQGRELMRQRVWIDSIGQRTLALHRPYLGQGQTRRVEVQFDSFNLRGDRPVRLEARLHPDHAFGAEIDSASIALRPVVSVPLVVAPGLLVALGGLLLMLLALALELYAALQAGPAVAPRRRFFRPVGAALRPQS